MRGAPAHPERFDAPAGARGVGAGGCGADRGGGGGDETTRFDVDEQRGNRWLVRFRLLGHVRAGWVGLWVAAALLLAVGFPNPTPHYDEYYHLLAARSLLHEGDLTIMDGAAPYERAWVFTHAVAAAQYVFGETLFAARLPSALAFALLVGGMFAWLRRRVGVEAASAAAGLLLLTLHPLHHAATVRFYGVHAAAVFLGVVCTFEWFRALQGQGGRASDSWMRGVPWFVAALLGWALAGHLQFTTLIPAGAVVLWAFPLIVLAWWRWPRARRRWALLAALGLTTVLVLALFFSGFAQRVLTAYHTPQLWAAGTADDLGFYHRWFAIWYAPLWYGVPVWVTLGWKRQRGVVSLAAAVLLVSIAAHSVVGTKADRYVAYTLPWLFVLAGVGLTEGLLALQHAVSGWFEAHPRWSGGARAAGWLAVGLGLSVVLGYGAWRVPGVSRAVVMAGGDTSRHPFRRSDWASAAPALRPWAQRADVVVSSAGLRALYHLGRVDAGLSVHGAAQFAAVGEAMTLRAPALTGPDELARLRASFERGLVTVDAEHWRHPAFVSDDSADWLEAALTEVPLPPGWGLRVFVWQDPVPDGDALATEPVPEPSPETHGRQASVIVRPSGGAVSPR